MLAKSKLRVVTILKDNIVKLRILIVNVATFYQFNLEHGLYTWKFTNYI